MIMIIVSIIFSAALIILDVRHARERKDLYNRIAAGSLHDYVGAETSRLPRKTLINKFQQVADDQYKPRVR